MSKHHFLLTVICDRDQIANNSVCEDCPNPGEVPDPLRLSCIACPKSQITVNGLCKDCLTPGDIPNDAPQPGQPGGGGIPTPGNPALALIPAGLEAVSVFPPWISPRTV